MDASESAVGAEARDNGFQPNYEAYHRSLSQELAAIKDRVRSLIRHWPTDGAFKESALRSVLRRHLPESLFIGTGFVVAGDECSNQVDVLIVRKDRPRLFSDGDLMIVTPDAVRGAIEVKTALNDGPAVQETIMKAACNAAKWRKAHFGFDNFLGLFVYEEREDRQDQILLALEAARVKYESPLDCVSCGADVFVDRPGHACGRTFDGWLSRKTDGMAAACFISKVVGRFSETSRFANPPAWEPSIATGTQLRHLPSGTGGIIEAVTV